MYEIIPSPGTENKTFSEIEKKIEMVKPFVKTIHIDICDGKFANNKTFSDTDSFKEYLKKMAATERSGWVAEDKGILFEVHLMVEEPISYIKQWADAGFTRFIGHIEKMSSQEEFVAEAQLYGDAALAIDKQTSVDAIKVPFDDLDALLVMTIQAGFSGQKFEESLLEKVKNVRGSYPDLAIEVDGGINDETIDVAAAAGANRFVATSFLFNLETPKTQFNLLEQKLQEIEGAEKEVQSS
jgi:ribulose-phosphate 3-epimerase